MENKKEIEIISLIVGVIKFVKKYFLHITIITIVGIAVGVLDFTLGRNYYSTEFVASCPVINNQIVYELVQPIRSYVRKGMYDSVSYKLDIPIDVAESIRDIDLDTSISQAVLISLEVYNKDRISEIQTGLIHYFNSIPYIENQITTKRKVLDSYIKQLDKQICELEQLQATVNSSLKNHQITSVAPGGLYGEMITLSDRRFELLIEYNSLEKFKVINTNIAFEAQKSLAENIGVYGIAGFLLSLLVSIILYFKMILKEQEKK